MKSRRRRHDPAVKAKVAIEALGGLRTISEIAQAHDLHPMQVRDWKKLLLENAGDLFSQGKRASGVPAEDFERERESLHAKIGEQAVQIDFLKKKCKQLGVSPD